MKDKNQNITAMKIGRLLGIVLAAFALAANFSVQASLDDKIEFTTNFANGEIAADEKIELNLSRDLSAGEGGFAVFLTDTDITVLLAVAPQKLSYTPRFLPLPPVGKFQLKIEDTKRIPIIAEGQYILLLRIEATDDKESDSDLAALGVGGGIVHSGAIAAFPMPTLKFFVSGKSEKIAGEENAPAGLSGFLSVKSNAPLIFNWKESSGAAVYRLEITDGQSKAILSAVLLSSVTIYRAPSWFWTRFKDGKIWRGASRRLTTTGKSSAGANRKD